MNAEEQVTPEKQATPAPVLDPDMDETQMPTELAPSRRGSSTRPLEPVMLGEGTEVRGTFRYRLKRQLGRGGFGSVYLADCLEQGELGTIPPMEVALKFFHRPESGDQMSMLKREVSALIPLQNKHIIRLYDWCLDRSPCFMAVEFHEQGSLLDKEYFHGNPADEATLINLLRDLLHALNDAHQSSILHLDIKPGNVLWHEANGYVLTDFGISQGTLVSHHVVETGLGSPGYQAPEQRECNRRWIGPRTDLWGLGATAWSIYTGLRLDLHPQVLSDSACLSGFGLPNVSKFRPIRPDLEELLMSLLATDPADRPGGAAEALAALDSLCSATPMETIPDGNRLRVFYTGDPVIRSVADNLVDPLWASICMAPRPVLQYVQFEKGEALCQQGEDAFRTFVLLSGAVIVERDGRPIARESREGTFLGENATLTGRPRTATIRADLPVWALMFNAAELEQFVMANPAVGIRLIKTLALRNRQNHNTFYGVDSSL